jgi:HEAT repeat protein
MSSSLARLPLVLKSLFVLAGLGLPVMVGLADAAPPAASSTPAPPSPEELSNMVRTFEGARRQEWCGTGPRPEQRSEQTVQQLVKFGPPILPMLKPHLSSHDETLRRHVFRVFSLVGGELAQAEIVAAFRSEWPGMRTDALLAMSQMQPLPKQSLTLFSQALKDPSSSVRSSALDILKGMSPAQLGQTGQQRLEQLKPLLRSQDVSDRAIAVRSLGVLAPEVPQALPQLIGALSDPHLLVRLEAVSTVALWKEQARAAVKPLEALTQDPHPPLQLKAIKALLAIDEAAARRFIPVLQRHVTHPPEKFNTQAEARALLARLGGG